MRRLAVFAGGFTLEAAERVWRRRRPRADEVLDLLADLVDKSLVVAEHARRRRCATGCSRPRALRPRAADGERRARGDPHGATPSTSATSSRGRGGVRDAGRGRVARPPGRHIDNVRAALDWASPAAGDPRSAWRSRRRRCPLWVQLSLMGECRARVAARRWRARRRQGTRPRAPACGSPPRSAGALTSGLGRHPETGRPGRPPSRSPSGSATAATGSGPSGGPAPRQPRRIPRRARRWHGGSPTCAAGSHGPAGPA